MTELSEAREREGSHLCGNCGCDCDERPKVAAEVLVTQLREANSRVRGADVPDFSQADYREVSDNLEQHFRRYVRLGQAARCPPRSTGEGMTQTQRCKHRHHSKCRGVVQVSTSEYERCDCDCHTPELTALREVRDAAVAYIDIETKTEWHGATFEGLLIAALLRSSGFFPVEPA